MKKLGELFTEFIQKYLIFTLNVFHLIARCDYQQLVKVRINWLAASEVYL